jgi:hypothetical protein
MKRLFLACWLAGCGTLVDDVQPPTDSTPDGGGGGGLICAADDPCTCAPCTSTSECMAGLQCVPGRRKGENCADARSVCLSAP